MGCQKHFTKIQRMKNTESEIKPIKIGKRPGTTYYFGCKDFTHNFRPQEVKIKNKVLRKKISVLFVDQINQDFKNKNTTTKNNPTLYKLMLQK